MEGGLDLNIYVALMRHFETIGLSRSVYMALSLSRMNVKLLFVLRKSHL